MQHMIVGFGDVEGADSVATVGDGWASGIEDAQAASIAPVLSKTGDIQWNWPVLAGGRAQVGPTPPPAFWPRRGGLMSSSDPGRPDVWCENVSHFQRLLTESDDLDALVAAGNYGIPSAFIGAAMGAPEPVAHAVCVMPLGQERVAQIVFSGTVRGIDGRVWYRHSGSAGWSPWSGAAGNRAGMADLLHLQDAADQQGHIVKINHHATGAGRKDSQTFGIDISNWPGAMQAIVVHQYSRIREAFRLDNTDANAAIYINNTQNLVRDPGGTGKGAAFLKFHPYSMDNFREFAYLMDDLTFLNETTKTWSFQSKSGPIVEFKNAGGEVVTSINQNGAFTGGDTGWATLRAPHVTPLTGTGSMRIRRVGPQVWLALEGVGFVTTADSEYLTESSLVPVGLRAPLGENPVGWVTAWEDTTVLPIAVVDRDRLRRLRYPAANVAPPTGTGELRGTLSWITDDPMPI